MPSAPPASCWPGPRPRRCAAGGDREALRLLMCDRDNAVASAKTARTVLAPVIVTAPASLREQLRQIPRDRRASVCAALACPPGADRQTRVLHQTLARLGQRVIMLAKTAADLEKQITAIAEDMTPGLAAAEPGLGALTAAQILLSWSQPGGSAMRPHSPCCRAPHRFRCPQAAPTATAPTGPATASSTAPCRSSPSAGCATRRPAGCGADRPAAVPRP